MIILRMILPPVKSPLLESIVQKIFPDPVSKKSALSRLSLISFWILMGLVPFSVLLVNRPGRVWISPKAQVEVCVPSWNTTEKRAALANVHSRGFSVSWMTTGDCRGYLVWFFDPSEAGVSLGDDRTITESKPQGDVNWVSPTGTHHVTLLLGNRRPSSGKIYLKIYSGDKNYEGTLDQLVPEDPNNPRRIMINLPEDPTYDPNRLPSPTNSPGAYSTEKDAFSECPNGKPAGECSGPNEKICTADNTLCCHKACFRPYPVWGEAKDHSGNPVEGALVYAYIGSAGRNNSNRLSTWTNSQGRWVIELANAHQVTSSEYDHDGSHVKKEFFDYRTNIDESGNQRGEQETDTVWVAAYGGHGLYEIESVSKKLHRVADVTPCNSRNTCTNHEICPMEKPSPICLADRYSIDPAIESLVPRQGPIGTLVTISGRNFGATRETNRVTFNSPSGEPKEVSEYVSWANTEIKVKVPAGAATGPVTVTVVGKPAAVSPYNFVVTESSRPPTCTSLTLDKTQAAPEDQVKVGVTAKSGSSNFKATSAITLVALRVSDNSTHGILTFSRCDGVDAKTTPCTDTTQGFTPAHAQIPQAGLYKFYVTMVNQEGKTCDDSPTSPAAQKCGCSAKELTVTAADAPQISDVRPNRGLRGTEVNVTVTGSKLHPNVTYKLSKGSDNIGGTINSTPAPSATSVSVKFNLPASATTGNWNLVATKGTSTASYPFIIVDSAEATVVTFFVELQGLDKSTSPRRQLKVNVGDQDYVVESLPQAQGRYVGAFVLPSSVTGLKEFKVWEPEVRLKRKFSGTVTAGDVNYYDWTGKKILAGDFDGNNKITLADFTGPQGILKPLQTGNKISLPITEALKKYDVNGDNALNVLDISLVLLNFSGLEVPGE